MHQGNWTCSKCGGAITELPFEPKSEVGLTCRTCFAKSKGDGEGAGNGAGASAGSGTSGQNATAQSNRPQFSGDWKCASCGNSITSLPFEPRSTNNLKCIDCFKKQ